MPTLAVCMNIPDLQIHFRDKYVCKKYPGSGFLPHLAKLCDDAGWEIIGGSEIGYECKDVYVLQEEFNRNGFHLISRGAKAQVLFCMESKMYSPLFYDQIPGLKKIFKYQILFEGGTHELKFPSYDLDERSTYIGKYKDRKSICMIASNKHWWNLPKEWYSLSPFRSAIRHQLHDARLEAIERNPNMDLYGPRWDNLDNLPPWWEDLKPTIRSIWKGPVKDKLDVLSQYSYSVCYENTLEPGYITEKIIHCYLTGTIPMYRGAFSVLHHGLFGSEYSNEDFANLVMKLMEEK